MFFFCACFLLALMGGKGSSCEEEGMWQRDLLVVHSKAVHSNVVHSKATLSKVVHSKVPLAEIWKQICKRYHFICNAFELNTKKEVTTG